MLYASYSSILFRFCDLVKETYKQEGLTWTLGFRLTIFTIYFFIYFDIIDFILFSKSEIMFKLFNAFSLYQ